MSDEFLTGDETRRGDLIVDIGDVARKAGDPSRAVEAFSTAAALARTTNSGSLLARAVLGIAGPWVPMGTTHEHVVALLDEALAALDHDDKELTLRLVARLAMELYFSPRDQERRKTLSAEALRLAHEIDDESALGQALMARRYALWGPDDLDERCAVTSEMVRIAENADDRDLAITAYAWRATDLVEIGDLKAADQDIDAYARLAEELGHPSFLWYVPMMKAMRAVASGQLALSETLMEDALTIGKRIQEQNVGPTTGIQLFFLRREQGRLVEVEEPLLDLCNEYPAVPAWRCLLGSLYAHLERQAEAENQLSLLGEELVGIPRDRNWLVAMATLGETSAWLRNRAKALLLYRLLRPFADRNVVASRTVACMGSVSHYLGILAACLGDAAAEGHFRDALRSNEEMGLAPFVAHSQREYASFLVTRRDRKDGVARGIGLGRAALQTYERLGMEHFAERTRGELLRGKQLSGASSGQAAASGDVHN